MPRAFIGAGSNVAPEENIREALRRLTKFVRIASISTFYRVPAIARPADPEFYNGVVAVDADLPPMSMKWSVLRRIESAFGRCRSEDKYAPRTIDFDLLLFGECVLSTKELTLPHPDIFKRAFVAIPLYEIAPDLVLPGFDIPIREVAGGFTTENMQALSEYSRQLRNEFAPRS